MIHWSGIPFLKFTAAFAAGIVTATFLPLKQPWEWYAASIFLVYLLVYITGRIRKELRFRLRSITGILAFITLFLSGLLFFEKNNDLLRNDHLSKLKQKTHYYQAIVNDVPQERNKTHKAEVLLDKVLTDSGWKEVRGKCIVYISKKNYQPVRYGDLLLIKGAPAEVAPPDNPHEFDYKKYLHYKHIHFTHFVNNNQYSIIEHDRGNAVLGFAYYLREYCRKTIVCYVPGSNEQSVATALLLGIKGTLDPEMAKVYSSTGTTHVLAVSGMHVAIVFQALVWMFYFAKSSFTNRYILPPILLTALWIYVMITGFCPSVLRAAIMFSLIIIAKSINRNSNIYNTIFFSAFLLLCIDPYMIMDVGFQLSYAAIIGIVYFTDKIYSLKEFKNVVTDKIWKATSMTLAAQLTTVPLTIFYFNQFPLYFLFANLLAIPLSTGMLYIGVVLLLFSKIPVIAEATGWFISILIWFMNYLLELISRLPFSTLQKIVVSPLQAIAMYLLLIFLCMFFYRKKLHYLYGTLAILAIISGDTLLQKFNTGDQKIFMVYKIKNHYALGFLNGTEAEVYTDSILAKDEEKINRHIEPHLLHSGIKKVSMNTGAIVQRFQSNKFDLYTWNTKSFLLVKAKMDNHSFPYVDYIIGKPENIESFQYTDNQKIILLESNNKKMMLSKFNKFNKSNRLNDIQSVEISFK